MKKITLVAILFIFVLACNNKNNPPEPFTRDMLPAQLFSINNAKDTLLETIHGSIIRIVAGSFNVTGNIQIEIKEAFTPAEILAAGLTTESNGKPLRSAGMIYINASVKGEKMELIKPVKISMPNSFYDPEMKIFKGIETDSGTVNWIDPIPTDTTPQTQNWELGKALFRSKCMSCHQIFTAQTGPALANVEYRGPWTNRKNIFGFIKNPPAYMAGDRYTQKLKSNYGSMMTSFPDLGDENIGAILDYIKNESVRPGALLEEQNFKDSISGPPVAIMDTTGSYDQEYIPPPCPDDTIYLPLRKQEESVFQGNLDSLLKANSANSNTIRQPEELEGLRIGFTDPNPTTGMYDFEIKTLGWYNIDAYVEGYAGTTNIKLSAELRIDFEITMHVYLFCPKNKMLSVGYDKMGNTYSFNKINNRIPLFINERAILFAFGSKGDKMYYGISEFRVKGDQQVIINVKETTADEIREALYSKEIEGIDLGIEKKEQKIIKRDCDENLKADTAINEK